MQTPNLETIIGIVLSVGILCILVLFGGGLMFLLSRRDRKLRQAASAWNSTTGRVIDSRVAHRSYFQLGITQEEAEARVKKIKEDNKPRPSDALAIALSLFGDGGELASDLLMSDGQKDLGEWPLVVYEYEVNGVKFISNRVGVEEVGGPTLGGSMYSAQLLKRYPKGTTVTVYYNPQNPKESALDR